LTNDDEKEAGEVEAIEVSAHNRSRWYHKRLDNNAALVNRSCR
jgi:hypothetical protein